MHQWWEIKTAWTTKLFTNVFLYYCGPSFEANDCSFVYAQQPPSSLFCNLYNSTASPPQLQLTLACGAWRTDGKTDKFTFDLRWFSNYSTKALDHDPDVCETYFNNISVLVPSPGQYWCQVLDYTDGPEHLLGRSNVAEILSWEWYSSLPMCEGVQSVMECKCADLRPPSSTSPSIINPQTCFVPETKIQTSAIAGENVCMLCCPTTKLMK